MLKRNVNLGFVLMLSLLYPAVLGSIFYSVLGNVYSYKPGTMGLEEISCTVMMVSVVVLFSVDFIYTSIHEAYRISEFAADCVILLAMLGAFDSINFLAHQPRPILFARWMCATFLIFVAWDYTKRGGMGARFDRLWRTEILWLTLFGILSLWNFGFVVPAVVAAGTATFMVLLFRDFYVAHLMPSQGHSTRSKQDDQILPTVETTS